MPCGCRHARGVVGRTPSGSTNPRVAPSVGLNSDHASPVTYATPYGVASLVKPRVAQSNPGTNQSEYGAPRATPWGQTLARNTVNARVIVERGPIWTPHYFRNNIGATLVDPMRAQTITRNRPYIGQMPLFSQPQIEKPSPASVKARRAW